MMKVMKGIQECRQYSYRLYATSQSDVFRKHACIIAECEKIAEVSDRPETAVSTARAKISLSGYQSPNAPCSASQAIGLHFLSPPGCPRVHPRHPSSTLRWHPPLQVHHFRHPEWLLQE